MTLRAAELCAGYGGLSASVERVLDFHVAWYAEHDPADSKQHSSKILAHRWPGVPNHGDITTLDYARAEPVDILLGGYPCQPASVAGKQLGVSRDVDAVAEILTELDTQGLYALAIVLADMVPRDPDADDAPFADEDT